VRVGDRVLAIDGREISGQKDPAQAIRLSKPEARACSALPPAEMITSIMAAADVFANGAPQHDDMRLVIARVR
jgi:hypothetical protein